MRCDRPPGAEHAACLGRVSIFSGLTRDELGRVAAYLRPRTLRDGERLYGVGDRLSRLFVVHRGRLRVVRITASGREQLIRVAGPGDVVGEYPFLTGRPPAAWVFAAEPTELCVFEHRDLAALIDAYPPIALRLLRSVTERLEEAEHRVAALTGVEVHQRLAEYLLGLPDHAADGRPAVRLPMSKKDVASYLGTTPESLSRAFHRLQTDGLVRVGAHGWVDLLDPAGLETLTT